MGDGADRHGARALAGAFAPNDLRNIAEAGFPFTDGLAVRALVVPDLAAMRQAAADNGTPLTILAAFRSHAQQADLFARRIDELGATRGGQPGGPARDTLSTSWAPPSMSPARATPTWTSPGGPAQPDSG